MPIAILKNKNESFEKLMRRFKRAVEKDDLLNVLREREFYVKPSVERKRAKAAARKRWERKQEELNPSKTSIFKKKKGRKARKRVNSEVREREREE